MEIVIFETEEWEAAACARLTPAHQLTCTRQPLQAQGVDAFAQAQVISPFVQSDLSGDILRRLPHLRLIATRSTGFDHIDLDYCHQAGVTVCNVPDYGDHTVAEHTFALLLALCRRIPRAVDRTRGGDFSQHGLRGFELSGKTLGVIGTGRIGRRVVEIARGFGMRVIAFDKAPNAQVVQTLGLRYASLPELLSASDVVTLHVPGGAGVLLGEAEIAAMKPGAVLINTARGGVVDIAALGRALAEGRLAGAALDVIAEERALRDEAETFRAESLDVERLRTMVADQALLRRPDVLVTPHIAYDTEEAVRRIIDTTLQNIEGFIRGAPQNVVGAPAASS